jgi:hypothetical protein
MKWSTKLSGGIIVKIKNFTPILQNKIALSAVDATIQIVPGKRTLEQYKKDVTNNCSQGNEGLLMKMANDYGL